MPETNIVVPVSNYSFFPFPDNTNDIYKNYFAEAFEITNGYLYLSLNKINSLGGLFRCKLPINIKNNEYEKLLEYRQGDIIYTCKITKQNKFIGTLTTTNQVIICDLNDTKNILYIDMIGLPNDLCIDPDNENIIYVGINIENETNYGNIIKMDYSDIKNIKQDIILGNHKTSQQKYPLVGLCGININKNEIMISTLNEVVVLNKVTNNLKQLVKNNKEYGLFDNIQYYNNTAYIAMFANSKFYYCLFNSNCIKFLLTRYHAYKGTFFDGDRTNKDRKMVKNSKISFISYNLSDDCKKYTYNTFDKAIPNFDNEITQINKINDNTFLVLNYKADGFLLINV
jgi:hypothetical protein